MHQQEVSVRTQCSPVSRRRKRNHDTVGIRFIAGCIRHIHRADLIKGGSDTGSRRNVAWFVRDVRSRHIPIRNQIFRHILQILHHIERFQGLIQIFTIFGFTIAYRITIDSPCLSATPDRFVGISLCRLAMTHFAIFDTVVDHMVATTIRAKMFLHGTVGMRHRDLIERRITGQTRSFEHQFQIHHIVNDNRTFPTPFGLPSAFHIPRLDNPGSRTKTSR